MEFRVPNMGEGVEEAQVLKVLVSPGVGVKKEQGIIEIETDKATVEVPSPASGTIEEIHVTAGDTITMGQLIATIYEDGASAETKEPAPKEEAPEAEEVKGPGKAQAETVDVSAAAAGEPQSSTADKADEDIAREKKTGFEKHVPGEGESVRAAQPSGAGPVFAAPSVRQFAREIGVPVREVSGSGPAGRISMEDVKRHAREHPQGSTAVPPALPDFGQWGEVEREAMTKIRQSTGRRMAQSWSLIPHVTLCEKADATELESIRQQYKGRLEAEGGKLTITAMLLKLVAAALKSHPRVATSIDMGNKTIVQKHYYHIGVAVDTPRGLVVPVIHDVDSKNIMELARELTALSGRARDNKLSLTDLEGAVFTVTNLGGLGTDYFTPIINHPESAILGIGRARHEPVYLKDRDTFEPRLMLPLSLSFDHRLMDGADGARFLHWLARAIEDPVVIIREG